MDEATIETELQNAWDKLSLDEQSFWQNKGRDFKKFYTRYYLNLTNTTTRPITTTNPSPTLF